MRYSCGSGGSLSSSSVTTTASQLQQQSHHAMSNAKQADDGSNRNFPLKETLLAAGTGFFLGMFYFYKKKQTLPFKVCYGMMWPTLGGGIMLTVTPSPEEMTQRLEHSRAVSKDDLRRQREANAATVEAMAKQYTSGQR